MPWLEDLKFPRGYQMGTHIPLLNLKFLLTFLAFDCTIDKNKRRKDSYAKH